MNRSVKSLVSITQDLLGRQLDGTFVSYQQHRSSTLHARINLKPPLVALAEVGNVPYELLKSALAKANPRQLYRIEKYNPVCSSILNFGCSVSLIAFFLFDAPLQIHSISCKIPMVHIVELEAMSVYTDHFAYQNSGFHMSFHFLISVTNIRWGNIRTRAFGEQRTLQVSNRKTEKYAKGSLYMYFE